MEINMDFKMNLITKKYTVASNLTQIQRGIL